MTAWLRPPANGLDLSMTPEGDCPLCWVLWTHHEPGDDPTLAYWNGEGWTTVWPSEGRLYPADFVAWWTPANIPPKPSPSSDVILSFTKTGEDYVNAPDEGVELLRTAIESGGPVAYIDLRNALTDRQRAVLDHIRSKTTEQGYAPTLREIGEALGMKSTNGVQDHVKALEKKGYIRRTYGTARSIVLTERKP